MSDRSDSRPQLIGHLGATTRVGGGSSGVEILLNFDPELSKQMRDVSKRNLNRQLAIVFNNVVVSAPYIRSEISRTAVLSGEFTNEEMRYLFACLSGGLVPAPPKTLLNENAEPTVR